MLMAPRELKLALPALMVLCAVWYCYRYTLRRHPALVVCFMSTATWGVLDLYIRGFRFYSIPFQLAVGAGFVLEVLALSRLMPKARVWLWIAVGVAGCVIGASIPRGFSLLERACLFRQYGYIELAAVAVWAAIYRLIHPLTSVTISIRRVRECHAECFRHKAYRLGVAAWMLSYAIAGSFVRGGLGYVRLPYTQRTMYTVEFCNIVALLIVVGVMTLAMAAPMPGRKRVAVWAGKQKAVTGRIEKVAA